VHEDTPFSGETLSAAARAARVLRGCSRLPRPHLTPELVLEHADEILDTRRWSSFATVGRLRYLEDDASTG
jgi:hypothetical protein